MLHWPSCHRVLESRAHVEGGKKSQEVSNCSLSYIACVRVLVCMKTDTDTDNPISLSHRTRVCNVCMSVCPSETAKSHFVRNGTISDNDNIIDWNK